MALGLVHGISFSASYQLVSRFAGKNTISLGLGCVGSGGIVLAVELALRITARPTQAQTLALYLVCSGDGSRGLALYTTHCGLTLEFYMWISLAQRPLQFDGQSSFSDVAWPCPQSLLWRTAASLSVHCRALHSLRSGGLGGGRVAAAAALEVDRGYRGAPTAVHGSRGGGRAPQAAALGAGLFHPGCLLYAQSAVASAS